MRHSTRTQLIFGEYFLGDQSEDSQTAAARSHLIEVSKAVVPEFLEELRTTVYPVFAHAAGGNLDYYKYGWRFRTWALVSDRDRIVQSSLLQWARKFDAEEDWVLEGALSTLRQWHSDAGWRDQLGTTGFHLAVAGEVLVPDDEHRFEFSDWGWDPQLISWPAFLARLSDKFEQEVSKYEQHIRTLAESRGGIRARRHYTTEHFQWLALYRLRGWSSGEIVRWLDQHTDSTPDQTTVLKGIRTAAGIVRWKLRRHRNKPES